MDKIFPSPASQPDSIGGNTTFTVFNKCCRVKEVNKNIFLKNDKVPHLNSIQINIY